MLTVGDIKNILLRFIKGMLVGTGFLLPGVSGGALAAVFGLYERLISFLAHPFKDFRKNVIFFIPVGVGMCAGIVLLSWMLSFFLSQYETQILWFFVGGIVGTVPSLWKEAGKKGRRGYHPVITAVILVLAFYLLRFGFSAVSGNLPRTFSIWVLAGVLIGLGMLVPGLSPSNFLVYMNLYKPMVDAFKTVDISVILPVLIGCGICVLLFSKIVDFFFTKYYAGMFHAMLGIVLASTVIIIPLNADYQGTMLLVCVLALIGGAGIGYWMGSLDDL